MITVLVVIGILLVVNVSLVRSLSTTNRIAANSAFKMGATQAAEAGIADAEAYVTALANRDADVANKYFSIMQAVDSNELPTTINWSNVTAEQLGNYQVRWVVERLCTVTPVTDATSQCWTAQDTIEGSKRAGSYVYSSQVQVYYRVTAKVSGPRNSESYLQAAVAK
jgi:type IV pilus assembly protein PilX